MSFSRICGQCRSEFIDTGFLGVCKFCGKILCYNCSNHAKTLIPIHIVAMFNGVDKHQIKYDVKKLGNIEKCENVDGCLLCSDCFNNVEVKEIVKKFYEINDKLKIDIEKLRVDIKNYKSKVVRFANFDYTDCKLNSQDKRVVE